MANTAQLILTCFLEMNTKRVIGQNNKTKVYQKNTVIQVGVP